MKAFIAAALLGSFAGCAGLANYAAYQQSPEGQAAQAQYQANQRANYCNQLRAYNPQTMHCTTYGANTTCQTMATPVLANSGCQ